MTPVTVLGLYLLTILAPGLRLEIVSKPGLTAEVCRIAGEAWASSGRRRGYECRLAQTKQTVTTTPTPTAP